jgi:hypothetical protein
LVRGPHRESANQNRFPSNAVRASLMVRFIRSTWPLSGTRSVGALLSACSRKGRRRYSEPIRGAPGARRCGQAADRQWGREPETRTPPNTPPRRRLGARTPRKAREGRRGRSPTPCARDMRAWRVPETVRRIFTRWWGSLAFFLSRCPELLVCLLPVNFRKCCFDGFKKIFPVQRLESHILVANLELHVLD